MRAHAADLPGALVVNELEPAARSLCPSIDAALARVRDAGADHALVSGSGPTVLGLFAEPAQAERAARELGVRRGRRAPVGGGVKPVWLVAAAALATFLVLRRRRLEATLLVGGGIAVVAHARLRPRPGAPAEPRRGAQVDRQDPRRSGPTLLVGVMAFLETGAFIGLLAPGETVILIGGVVAGQGKIDIVALIAIIWACAVAGDVTSFFLGRRLGRAFLVKHGPKVQITEERLHTVEGFFDRHGGKAIFLGRFVGLVRAVAPFLAGSSGMPLRRFLPYDVLGAGLWGTTFALLGFFFWRSIDRVLALAKQGALALADGHRPHHGAGVARALGARAASTAGRPATGWSRRSASRSSARSSGSRCRSCAAAEAPGALRLEPRHARATSASS